MTARCGYFRALSVAAFAAGVCAVAPFDAWSQTSVSKDWTIDISKDESKTFDQNLSARLDGLVAKVAAPRDAAGNMLDSNGNTVSGSTVAGFILIRDAKVSQLNAFATGLDKVATLPFTDRQDLVTGLLPTADQASALFGQMNALQRADRTEVRIDGKLVRTNEWTSRAAYSDRMAKAAAADKGGDTQKAAELRGQAAETNWGKVLVVRQQYIDLIQKNPLLALYVDGKFYWQILSDQRDGAGAATTLSLFARDSATALRAEAVTTSNIWTLDGLVPFGSDTCLAQQQSLIDMGKALGSERIVMYVNDARGNTTAINLVSNYFQDLRNAAMGAAVASLMWTPVGWVAAGAAGVYGVYQDGDQLIIALDQAEMAKTLAAVNGMKAVQQGEERVAAATERLILSTLLNGIDIAEMGVKSIRLVRVRRGATGAVEVVDTAGDSARIAASNVPAPDPLTVLPMGAFAKVAPVTDAGGILARLDGTVLSKAGAGDAAFFTRIGIVPERTVEVGGRTWHVSKPFVFGRSTTEPFGRIAVVAFEETPLGTVVPRTFYLSNSHGIWKIAPAGGAQGLDKGPRRFVDAVFDPAKSLDEAASEGNQLVVDAAAELQKPLSDWFGEAGLLNITADADANKAAWGHLDPSLHGSEFSKWITAGDIFDPIPRGAGSPDFSQGPLQAWTYQHPMLGKVEGFLYPSTTGDTMFVALRDAQGHVWVPSIQDPWAGVTPFGNRWSAIDAKTLTDMPFDYRAELPGGGRAANGMIPDEFAKNYAFNPNYENPLNMTFAANLPPPGSAATTLPLPRMAPFAGPRTLAGATAPGPSIWAARYGLEPLLAQYGLEGLGSGPSVSAATAVLGGGHGVPVTDELTAALEARGLPGNPAEARRLLDTIPPELRNVQWQQISTAIDQRLAQPVNVSSAGVGSVAAGGGSGGAPRFNAPDFTIGPGGRRGEGPGTTGAVNGPFLIAPPRTDLRFNYSWFVNPQYIQVAPPAPRTQAVGATTDGEEIVVPGKGRGGRQQGMAAPSGRFAHTLVEVFRRFFTLPAPRAASRWSASAAVGPSASYPQRPPADHARLTLYVTSLGVSTGDAFTVTALNSGDDPVVIVGDDLVLEPVSGVTAQQVERDIARQRTAGKRTVTMTAYCLEFAKSAPTLGQVFRVAGRMQTDQLLNYRYVIEASRRMSRFGLLPQDGGDPRTYVHSIRQWAIWTREQRFDQTRFADAFVDFTKKNAEQAGRQWTPAFDRSARALVPGRWKAVQFVLDDAARLERAERNRPAPPAARP